MPENQIKAFVFDWGDTVMRDFGLAGPMSAWDRVAWIPGAEEALAYLSAKYCCIIATGASHSDVPEMRKALARVGADAYFHHFFSRFEIGYDKPDVRFFDSVLRLAGFRPQQTVMVGNLYEKDIIGAKAAGMTTIWFNEAGLTGHFPQADIIIGDLRQLTKMGY
ncbi:MAG TPA: HAD family hydrolase [Bacteroidales bacterium]|nr:HAD family hydrolase [Bacteroidales bacterium]